MTENDPRAAARPAPALSDKVQDWLRTEGYPLEFSTADSFRRAGFHVRQGDYTESRNSGVRREVDVVAYLDRRIGKNYLLRVQTVVECKWSGDKPWVLFCGDGAMNPAACATQSFSSQLGNLLLWKEAGNPILAGLDLFGRRKITAFGGRQAFGKSNDVVFDTIRAIVGNCRDLADEYDDGRPPSASGLPRHAGVTFPVIVVDGHIFEAYQGDGALEVREVDSTRMNWRGSDRHKYPIASLDIVRVDHLDSFVAKRAEETRILLQVMATALEEVEGLLVQGRLDDLQVTRGARGVLGHPALLHRLLEAAKKPSPPVTSG